MFIIDALTGRNDMIKHILGVAAVLMVVGCQTVGGGPTTSGATSIQEAMTVAKGKDEITRFIRAVCVEGYIAGDAETAAQKYDGAIQVELAGYAAGSKSYGVEVADDATAVATLIGPDELCTITAPLGLSPDVQEISDALGGTRVLMERDGVTQLFLKEHNLMALVQNVRIKGAKGPRRIFVTSNKKAWDAMINDFEQQRIVVPKEFYIHAWLR